MYTKQLCDREAPMSIIVIIVPITKSYQRHDIYAKLVYHNTRWCALCTSFICCVLYAQDHVARAFNGHNHAQPSSAVWLHWSRERTQRGTTINLALRDWTGLSTERHPPLNSIKRSGFFSVQHENWIAAWSNIFMWRIPCQIGHKVLESPVYYIQLKTKMYLNFKISKYKMPKFITEKHCTVHSNFTLTRIYFHCYSIFVYILKTSLYVINIV